MAREAEFLQEGNVIEVTTDSSTEYSAGDVVVLGANAVGVALVDIAKSGTGAVKLDGVYKIAADNATAFSFGDQLFWDDTNSELTKTATDMVAAGICVEAKAEAGTTAKVLLTQGVGAAATTT
jgi:predicted RecA/RadA family phage recombinase